MGDESSVLKKGVRNFSPNRNYERTSKSKTYIKIGAGLAVILIIFLCIGLYFLMRKPTSPSLKMIPESNGNINLIAFNQDNYERLTEIINKALEVYNEPCKGNCTRQQCELKNKKNAGQPCTVQLENLAPCTKSLNYGYPMKSPCIFLYISDTSDWMPVFFNDTTKLPIEMPMYLKDRIFLTNQSNPAKLNTIWISCEPMSPSTWDDMGAIQYIPMQGIPGYFYPEDLVGFQPPLVAIFFEKPKVNKRINVVCKAWARNLNDATKTFQILIS